MLLIAGSMEDPDLNAVAVAAGELEVPICDYRTSFDIKPLFHWQIGSYNIPFPEAVKAAFLYTESRMLMHSDTSKDTQMQTRASSWHQAIEGWLLAQDHIRIVNRNIRMGATNKLTVLTNADRFGLHIPKSWVTNDLQKVSALEPHKEYIIKSIPLGSDCLGLKDFFHAGAERHDYPNDYPLVVQNRLITPEGRLFLIGSEVLAFRIKRDEFNDDESSWGIELIESPTKSVEALHKLMAYFRTDFAAADFKTHPETGEPILLGLHVAPKFAIFDQASRGAVAQALVRYLLKIQPVKHPV